LFSRLAVRNQQRRFFKSGVEQTALDELCQSKIEIIFVLSARALCARRFDGMPDVNNDAEARAVAARRAGFGGASYPLRGGVIARAKSQRERSNHSDGEAARIHVARFP